MAKLMSLVFIAVLLNFIAAEKVKLICKDKSDGCATRKERQCSIIESMVCRKSCKACGCKDFGDEICKSKDICRASEGRLLCQRTCNTCEFHLLTAEEAFSVQEKGKQVNSTKNNTDSSASTAEWMKKLINEKLKEEVKQKSPSTSTNTSIGDVSNSNGDLSSNCLNAHNEKRKLHKDTPDLKWDSNLAKSAQQWADQIAAMGTLEHSQSRDYGENLYMTTRKNVENGCEKAVKSWYNEIKGFDWKNPSFQGINGAVVGHFTQLVWKGSTKLGCGVGNGNKGTYVACQYKTPGNMMKKFKENVQPLK